MIKSFADKEADKIWNGIQLRKLPANIQNVARRKLRMINNTQNINDLRIPPANHLEKVREAYNRIINMRAGNCIIETKISQPF